MLDASKTVNSVREAIIRIRGYDNAAFSYCSQHHWFSGKISACHAGASGSIRHPAPVSHDSPE
jgi:hypothetical protein